MIGEGIHSAGFDLVFVTNQHPGCAVFSDQVSFPDENRYPSAAMSCA